MNCLISCPLGFVSVEHRDGVVVGCEILPKETTPAVVCVDESHEMCRAIERYFLQQGNLSGIEVAFEEGTAFQRAVWEAIRGIPMGETRSYGQIAAMIERPKAVRAVGGALNRNPIWLIVPCHRVVGADGSMTGYAGGVATKEWLLWFERGLVKPA